MQQLTSNTTTDNWRLQPGYLAEGGSDFKVREARDSRAFLITLLSRFIFYSVVF